MASKKKLIVLSGSGISAESGIRTFRDMNGLWRNYRVEEVASPEGWENHRQDVHDFYNMRRKQLYEVKPNAGHEVLVELEKYFDVQIVTQNVDDLHEQAGSSKVLHLHGELKKVRSTADESLVYELDGWELKEGDLCEKGSQLRPHIVWFGEAVPAIEEAANICTQADYFVIVGTSMQVYPAAGLIDFVPSGVPVFLVDPGSFSGFESGQFDHIQETGTIGLPLLKDKLMNYV